MIIIPKRRARLFYYDETDLHWCPDVGRSYQLPGSQVKVNSPGRDQVLYLLGSIEYPTGAGLYELYPRKTNFFVQQHLTHLIEMCEPDFCFVIWDNAPQHTTQMLLPFLWDNQHRLGTVNLPTYSPHLNLIERLWRHMRDNITRNHFYDSFDKLCQASMEWFDRLPLSRFQSLMGIEPRAAPLAA